MAASLLAGLSACSSSPPVPSFAEPALIAGTEGATRVVSDGQHLYYGIGATLYRRPFSADGAAEVFYESEVAARGFDRGRGAGHWRREPRLHRALPG